MIPQDHQEPADTIAMKCACGFEGPAPITMSAPGIPASIKGPAEPAEFTITCPKCGAAWDLEDARGITVEFEDEAEGDRMDEGGDH